MVDEKTGEFQGLPEDLKEQIDNSGFNKKQIAQHPE
jgi:protein-serine/threonine kinase